MTPKKYHVEAALKFPLMSYLQTEKEIREQVREYLETLGLGGVVRVFVEEIE